VFLDRPDGLYSTMEVDKVDAHKYPGLDKVKFQHTELHGGDCVFIPYKWSAYVFASMKILIYKSILAAVSP